MLRPTQGIEWIPNRVMYFVRKTLEVIGFQKENRSGMIWRNAPCDVPAPPFFPYKNDWKGEETVQSFLYGKKGGAGTSHGAFRQIMSDRFSFWNPRTWSVFLTKCITRIWIHSLSWVGRNENSRYPTLSWASQYLPSCIICINWYIKIKRCMKGIRGNCL